MGVAGVSLFNITTDLTKGGTPSALVVKGTYAVLCVALMSPQWKPEMLTILANDH